MNYILTKRGSRDTVEGITNGLEIEPLFYSIRRHRIVGRYDYNVNTLIKWGVSYSPPMKAEYVLNSRGIGLTSNKGKCREFLNNQGIPVPEPISIERLRRLVKGIDSNFFGLFPLVVRPEFHQKGKDFLLFHNIYELSSRWGEITRLTNPYASKFYPKTREYRVHVAHGKVLAVQEKLQTSDMHKENWNHDSGYEFALVPWKSYNKSVVDLGVRALECTGLDFGAVDILADPEVEGLPNEVVCEINTAPRLEGYTAQRYVEYFDWFLDTQETRHFEIPEGTKARHYAFKHRELEYGDYDFDFKE